MQHFEISLNLKKNIFDFIQWQRSIDNDRSEHGPCVQLGCKETSISWSDIREKMIENRAQIEKPN